LDTPAVETSDHRDPDAVLDASAAARSPEEARNVEQRLRLRAPIVYEIVRKEGLEEIRRPTSALWWSGLAAGLGIGFSVVAEALLIEALPEAPWAPLVTNLGYCVGFLIVVLGRQQLFTENTVTAVLPVLASPRRETLLGTLRLWSVVFLANQLGTAAFAWALVEGGILEGGTRAAVLEMSRHMLALEPATMLTRGIVAGWLIAAMVWIMPSAKGAEFWVIGLITYLIALGDFTHCIAGSVEAYAVVFVGETNLGTALVTFLLPTFLGNVVGGTALFALLSYAQVEKEI
jgi:formate/nitrite transporter FocA (FNT family)